jgi:hypothetical protein
MYTWFGSQHSWVDNLESVFLPHILCFWNLHICCYCLSHYWNLHICCYCLFCYWNLHISCYCSCGTQITAMCSKPVRPVWRSCGWIILISTLFTSQLLLSILVWSSSLFYLALMKSILCYVSLCDSLNWLSILISICNRRWHNCQCSWWRWCAWYWYHNLIGDNMACHGRSCFQGIGSQHWD